MRHEKKAGQADRQSVWPQEEKKDNDISVASSGEGDYTSGGMAEVGPSSERGIIQ